MSTKVGNLNELSNILRQKDSVDEKALTFSKQFIKCVSRKGDTNGIATKCFVLDDTVIETKLSTNSKSGLNF